MNREQVCTINGHTSSPKKIICGIPQGSILGPLLFLIYINDLLYRINSKKTTPCLYADDTQISSSSNDYNELIDKLNSDLQQISDWLASNKLQHHPTKTKYMIIGSSYNLTNI
jgi:retron-type reverse transcriptase